ncbi:MAG: filamentous hemagglutinin N-terminal domain-containing protein [Hormoscilla sp.]
MRWSQTGRRLPIGIVSAISAICYGISSGATVAQIVPDATLPLNTTVTQQGGTFTIEGGTTATRNLFHSFREFSVPTGDSAFFNNGAEISNIISRVTGGKISNIDGLIRANGTANLFLINPNGILFGPNARLDIGGSFLGSTADSLLFDDGKVFSATEPQTSPLLTINVPIGLQYGPSPGSIRVEGTGHNLTTFGGIDAGFSPFDLGSGNAGIEVSPGKTIILVGGDVILAGGTLTAESGRISLGSVRSGTVGLDGWTLDYEGVDLFGDIRLLEKAAVNGSGMEAGSIHLQGQNISLEDSSIILMQNQGSQPGGQISLEASEEVVVSGAILEILSSSLHNQTVGSGKAGDIRVSTERLVLSDGGSIVSRTFGDGKGGNITVSAAESVELTVNNNRTSAITAGTVGNGDAGDVTLSTERLMAVNGGSVGSLSLGDGKGGDVTVNVTESIELIGVNQRISSASSMNAATIGNGDAGNLTVNTSRLILLDGGRVGSNTATNGNGGSVTVNASESVVVSGRSSGSIEPSQVGSSANIVDVAFRQEFGLPDSPSGDAGNVTVNTPVLRVTDAGLIAVRNEGLGKAGNLQVLAREIILKDEGGITASTASGEGGDITINVEELLLARRGSEISAEAGGSGNGGNLEINTDTLVLLQSSNINADAFGGDGGNIAITTRGMFVSPSSEITASSELGVDGTVTINNPDVDSSSSLVKLPEKVTDPSDRIIAGCRVGEENALTITGRGGLAEDPTGTILGSTVWRDEEDYSGLRTGSSYRQNQPLMRESQQPLTEATGWVKHPDGTVELVAVLPHVREQRLKPVDCNNFSGR